MPALTAPARVGERASRFCVDISRVTVNFVHKTEIFPKFVQIPRRHRVYSR